MSTSQPGQGIPFSTDPWWLPDFIKRQFDIPAVPPVQSSTLVLLDPDLLGRTVPEIRSLLKARSPSYINGLRAFLPETHFVNLRARIITLVQSPNPPTPFILPDAAFILEGSGFFPFHAVLMATYCSRVDFDILSSSAGDQPFPERTFNIRLFSLSFSNELVMACFREWIYRQDEAMLRPAILPSSTLLPPTSPFDSLQQDVTSRRGLADDLSRTCSELQLWNFVLNVLDFRRLMTMLGVDDLQIWTSLSLAWEILLEALNSSCISISAEDAARGVDTSKIRALLRDGLGVFDTLPRSIP